MPGERIRASPGVCCSLLLGPIVQAGKRRHINVGAVRAESSVGQRWPGSRFLQLLDFQVATACVVMGRSSSRSLNRKLESRATEIASQSLYPADAA